MKRVAIRSVTSLVKVPSTDATARATRPASRTRRRPSTSAQRPPSSRKPPEPSTNAETIHCSDPPPRCSADPIEGSATWTSERSSVSRKTTPQTTASRSFSCFVQSAIDVPERRVVDDEAVADVGGQNALPGLVDLFGGDDLDLGGDAMLGAEVEHLLGLADRADGRAGEAAALEQQREHRDRQRLRRGAHVDERAVGLEQAQEAAHVDARADRVDDQVEVVGELGERGVVAGGVVGVGAELEPVLLLAQRLR